MKVVLLNDMSGCCIELKTKNGGSEHPFSQVQTTNVAGKGRMWKKGNTYHGCEIRTSMTLGSRRRSYNFAPPSWRSHRRRELLERDERWVASPRQRAWHPVRKQPFGQQGVN